MPKEYYLYVNEQKVKVSEQIYKVYWREGRYPETDIGELRFRYGDVNVDILRRVVIFYLIRLRTYRFRLRSPAMYVSW